MEKGTFETKVGLAEMLKGGVIMDVTNAEQAKIFNAVYHRTSCDQINNTNTKDQRCLWTLRKIQFREK